MGDLDRAISRNTLLLPALSVALGILFCLKLHLQWIFGIALLFVAAALYFLLLKLSKDSIAAFKLRNFHYSWLCIAFFGLGILSATFRTPAYINIPFSDKDYFIHGIIESVQEKTYGDMMIVEVKSIMGIQEQHADGMKLKVNVTGGGGMFKVGDIVFINGSLKRIEDNPNSFYAGYKSLMNNRGIYYVSNIIDQDVTVIGHYNNLAFYSAAIRDRIEEFIENTSLNKPVQNFLITLLLGDRSYLDPQLQTKFSEAGVSHVLALSGMHVGIIGGVFLFLLFPFNFYGRYKLRLVLTALLLWFYAFISGMTPSTIRACIMISFVTIAIISERKRYALNALSGSVLIILLYSPQTLLDVGFQLSVVCVGSLILFTESINLFPRGGNRYVYKFAEIVVATSVATFASWLLTCYYFHSFPLSFLPSNLIMLPILPIYLILALLYFALSAIGLPTGFMTLILDKGYYFIDNVINFIGKDSSLEIWVGTDTLILWFSGLALLALYLNLYKWKPMIIAGCTLLGCTIVVIILNRTAVEPGSMIITNNYNAFTVNVKTNNSEQAVNVNRYANNAVNIDRHKLMVLDSRMPDISKLRKCDYLIIGGSYKGDIIKAAEAVTPAAVVIHPSVRRKREREYIDSLKNHGFKVHSLRLNAPMRILIPSEK